jgi:hypothetical protein
MRRKRRKTRPVLSRPTLLAGALLAAALGVLVWRQVLSSRGAAREVPIAPAPAIDQTDNDPAVVRLISGAPGESPAAGGSFVLRTGQSYETTRPAMTHS